MEPEERTRPLILPMRVRVRNVMASHQTRLAASAGSVVRIRVGVVLRVTQAFLMRPDLLILQNMAVSPRM
jgi:hypothetical protein